jgi:hypothetical protein
MGQMNFHSISQTKTSFHMTTKSTTPVARVPKDNELNIDVDKLAEVDENVNMASPLQNSGGMILS